MLCWLSDLQAANSQGGDWPAGSLQGSSSLEVLPPSGGTGVPLGCDRLVKKVAKTGGKGTASSVKFGFISSQVPVKKAYNSPEAL